MTMDNAMDPKAPIAKPLHTPTSSIPLQNNTELSQKQISKISNSLKSNIK